MFRLLIACVAGASALHVIDGHLLHKSIAASEDQHSIKAGAGDVRILFFGASLDRNAVMGWCNGRGGHGTEPVEAAWCSDEENETSVGFLFHPGVGFNGDCKHPIAIPLGYATGRILRRFARKTAFLMLEGEPDMVVVDSSLWDLFAWRKATTRNLNRTKEVTEERVQQWCQHDLPSLLEKVSIIFPASRIIFRTAPTIEHTPNLEKFKKEDIELLYQCVKSSTIEGKLFGKYEIIDYHAIMQNLIDRNVPGLFRNDGYHPDWYPSALYMNEVLRRAGLHQEDPSAPVLANGRTVDRKAEFEAAIQGDPNDIALF